MSDQDMEMQFADPDWQPTQRPPVSPVREQPFPAPAPVKVDDSPDPRQQSSDPGELVSPEVSDRDKARDYAEYSQGYQGTRSQDSSAKSDSSQDQQTSQKSQKTQKKGGSRGGSLFWIVAAIILIALIANPIGEDFVAIFWRVLIPAVIVIGLFALFFAITRNRRSISSIETHTFSVETQPKIIIKNNAGAIRVHPGGEEYQVVVQTTRRGRVWLGGHIDVQYDQKTAKNSLAVKANGGWSFIGSQWVDFDITVPRNADLELKNDAGSITVDGIAGQFSCVTNAGSVKVTDSWLYGNSRLKTDAGSIAFSGALDPRGSYSMGSDAGSVSVTLPPNASFRLDARTDVGSINSDFPLTIQRDYPGGKARCDVGLPPYPTLKLRTDVGSINIRQLGD